jgi:hypothetical protein
LNRAIAEAQRAGDIVKVVSGTKVKEITPEQLEAEAEVYSEASVDDRTTVKRKLKEINN